jgi:YfiH family protein
MLSIFKSYPDLFCTLSEQNNGSMKLPGNSKNRRDFLLKNNLNPNSLVSADLIHGNGIARITEKDKSEIITGTDGLITNRKNIFLSVTVADCLPIYLYESEKEIVGIIHAGWRSLMKNILVNAIEKTKKLGGKPENVLIGIGPAICQKHYEVGLEVAEKFEKYPKAIERKNNRIFLDLKEIAKLQLLKLGMPEKNIEISPECTYELPEKYFSARRDKRKEIEAMIAMIGIQS